MVITSEFDYWYAQDIRDLQNELSETIERFAKEKIATVEAINIEEDTVYGESPVQARIHKFTELQDKGNV